MFVSNTGGLQVERNFVALRNMMVCSYFISLIGPVIEVGSGIFTPTSVTI